MAQDIDDPMDGSIESIAAMIDAKASQAIGALLNDGGHDDVDDEVEEIAAAIEAKGVPEAPAAEQHPNTGEEAPEGEPPAAPAQAEPAPQAKVEPAPAPRPAPVATQPATPLTAQDQLAQLNQLVPVLRGQLQAAFPDVRSQDDLMKLAVEDPARYIVFKAHQDRIQQAEGLRAQAQAAYASEWDAREAAKLHELLPETADPVKGPALSAKLRDYAKECGYSDQQIRWAAASDVKMLHDAMQFRDRAAADKAKAEADAKAIEEARKKAAEAPPVQKPGVAPKADTKGDKLKELEERYEKSGRIDDLTALLAYRDQNRAA